MLLLIKRVYAENLYCWRIKFFRAETIRVGSTAVKINGNIIFVIK